MDVDRIVMRICIILGIVTLMLVTFDMTHDTCTTDSECEELHGIEI